MFNNPLFLLMNYFTSFKEYCAFSEKIYCPSIATVAVDICWYQCGNFKRGCKACNFIKKESLAQVFPCELCEISNNIFAKFLITFFYRIPLVVAYKRKQNFISCLLLYLSPEECPEKIQFSKASIMESFCENT